jgi:hypothetical protein
LVGERLAPSYNYRVARGWESKSVEEQQSEAISSPAQLKQQLTPQQIAKQRQREGLTLARKRILQQLRGAHNPLHVEMLNRALTDLDVQLAQLD